MDRKGQLTCVFVTTLCMSFVMAHLNEPPPVIEYKLENGNVIIGDLVVIPDSDSSSTSENSKYYYAFRNIPYAKPPNGKLRFKDPEEPENWGEGGQPNRNQSIVCPQLGVPPIFESKTYYGNEDCLLLHIYVPNTDQMNLPVMVYIHGGGFLFGEAEYSGGDPEKFMEKQVILVSIQYRLGVLGFLSTNDDVIPGNFGLKDQTMALKWIHKNIRSVGGDPDTITIFGQSAGAASVHFQLLTPQSKGLFKRAILQSGTAICPWAYRYDHNITAAKIGENVTCSIQDGSEAFLECLRSASAEDLVQALNNTKHYYDVKFSLVPRVDGVYLPAAPATMLRNGDYHKVDLISGVTMNEGGLFITEALNLLMTNSNSVFDTYREISRDLSFDNDPNMKYLTNRAFYHYMQGMTEINDTTIQQLEKLISDGYMNICNDVSAMLHGRDAQFGTRTFRYELQYHGHRSIIEAYPTEFGKNWITHCDDLPYLFPNVYKNHLRTDRVDDVFLSDIMITLWTNFARTGNPTPDMNLGFKWKPLSSDSGLEFLSLSPSPMMKEDNRKKVREFWLDLPTQMNKEIYPERFGQTEH